MDGSQHVEAPVVVEVTTTSFAVVIGLSNDAQITFQSGFAADESDEAINARLDRTMKLAARQRDRLELPVKQKELDELRNELDNQDQHIATAEVDHQKAVAAVDVQILEVQERKQAVYDAGYVAHRNTGKQSAYEPRGATAANLHNHDTEIDRLKGERERLHAEKKVFLENLDTNTNRLKARRALVEDQMARLKASLET